MLRKYGNVHCFSSRDEGCIRGSQALGHENYMLLVIFSFKTFLKKQGIYGEIKKQALRFLSANTE